LLFGGHPPNQLTPLKKLQITCHSERSEESKKNYQTIEFGNNKVRSKT